MWGYRVGVGLGKHVWCFSTNGTGLSPGDNHGPHKGSPALTQLQCHGLGFLSDEATTDPSNLRALHQYHKPAHYILWSVRSQGESQGAHHCWHLPLTAVCGLCVRRGVFCQYVPLTAFQKVCDIRPTNGSGTTTYGCPNCTLGSVCLPAPMLITTLTYPTLPNAKNYPTLPYPTLPYPTLPYPTLPYPTLPYPTLPYPTLPYPTLPYPTLPYPTLPYPTPHYTTLHHTSERFLRHPARLPPG